jgi:CHAT domain-containing protein
VKFGFVAKHRETWPVDGLCEAQLQMRSDPRTAHPFYWAAFGVYLGS